MKSGTKPTRTDHRDFDFIQSHNFGSISPTFKDEFFADAGLTMPDQETADNEFMPPTPPMPFGCTDFASAELATDLTKLKHNPNDLEAVTHANALGGYDIRKSLQAAIALGWFKQFFNITASGVLDAFDSFRLAQLAGVDVGENRSISWGTPWFPSWEQAALQGKSIMMMPTTAELASISTMSWHDSKLDGWTPKNGVAVYRDKSWQGNLIGDGGFLYFPREVINAVMGIRGTVAFTATNNPVNSPITINTTTLEWLISALQNLIERYIPITF
jgi:hypothetical protein